MLVWRSVRTGAGIRESLWPYRELFFGASNLLPEFVLPLVEYD